MFPLNVSQPIYLLYLIQQSSVFIALRVNHVHCSARSRIVHSEIDFTIRNSMCIYAAYKSLHAFIKCTEVIRYFILPAINLTVNYDMFYYARVTCIAYLTIHKGNDGNAHLICFFLKLFLDR